MIRWRFCGATDVGRRRSKNEDYWGFDDKRGIFIVADGMGGHAAGEQASRIAVDTILAFMRSADEDLDITWPGGITDPSARTEDMLRAAMLMAHQRILEATRENPEWQGMATTAVVAKIDPEMESAIIAHVGDSRGYLIRRGRIIQLTQDHSWVNEQIRVGLISAEEARSHPFRNVVTRALGGPQEPVVDIGEEPLEPGDLLLLCTDGLSGVLDDVEIADVIHRHMPDLQAAVANLIQTANDRGGPDNITVVLIQIERNADTG